MGSYNVTNNFFHAFIFGRENDRSSAEKNNKVGLELLHGTVWCMCHLAPTSWRWRCCAETSTGEIRGFDYMSEPLPVTGALRGCEKPMSAETLVVDTSTVLCVIVWTLFSHMFQIAQDMGNASTNPSDSETAETKPCIQKLNASISKWSTTDLGKN